uniref:RNA polymerase III subunit GL n=1 Tax=Nothoprocta perdicaria TaxID=30464 RepID=A0A8C6YTX5_NOTPE
MGGRAGGRGGHGIMMGGHRGGDMRGTRGGTQCGHPDPPCHRPPPDIERYSDKYQVGSPVDGAIDWSPDWRRLPRELRIRVRRLRMGGECPGWDGRDGMDGTDWMGWTLEKKEEEVTSEEEEKEEEEEGKEEEEEEYDEEEHEEETDYIMSYFDNGEDFGADSDDNADEAVY